MKKLLSLWILVFFLVSSLNCWTIYAYEVSALESTKDKSIEALVNVEKVVDTTVEKIDAKTSDAEIEARLEQKQEEIKEYLEEAKEQIQAETSKWDIKEILEETKKVVVLKVVSWVTEYENIDEFIPKELTKNESSKEHAIDVIQNSLETKSWDYSLIIKSKFLKEKVEKTISMFDEKLKVNFLYESDWDNYFEIIVSEDSIFKREMLEDIENGNIPESFLWIDIIKPEVFWINEINIQEEIVWENLESTRWVKLYNTTKYFNTIKDNWKIIKVWIVDTWIDYNHPDIKWKVVLWYDFVNDDNDAMDDQWHWTHVSGTIAANLNKAGIIWVNPYVQLVPLKICDSKWFCPTYAVIKALEYAKEKKIDILNMSLWWRWDPKTSPICDWIDSVVKSWAVVVAAAWNSNVDTSTFVPGWCNQAITVAAVDSNLTRASFSNYGSKVDVGAPWVKVYSTYTWNNYKELSGTSMATPHIVWLVSIIKSFKPELSKDEILSIIKDNSLPVKTDNWKPIAYFANVWTIIDYLTIKEVVIEEKIPLIEPISPETKTEELKDNAIIDENLVFVENQEDIDTTTDTPEEAYTPNMTTIQNIKMDFWDKNAPLVINANDLSTSFELIDIKEPVENAKPYSNSPALQSFNASWNSVKINSADETEAEVDEWEEILWWWNEVGTDFDINNLPQNQVEENVIEENVEENIEEEIKTEKKVIHLDWWDDSVEINSVWDEDLAANYDEADYTDVELIEYKENNIIDVNWNVIENLDLTKFQQEENSEWVEINSVWDEEFENYGYNADWPITETPDDLGNLAEENMGIQNASWPIKVSNIEHTFWNLMDNKIYDWYITYWSYKYPLNYSRRWNISNNYIEAKVVDNTYSLFTQDRFEYKSYVSPKKFNGKFKTNLPTSTRWRNQLGYLWISSSDENDVLISLWITTFQSPSINYTIWRKRPNYICSTNIITDEVECYNNKFEHGRYLVLNYKKENWKYSVLNYKLPDSLIWEYTVQFSVDFETKKINAKFYDISNTLKEDLNLSFEKLSDFKNIDFSDFKYVVKAFTTNNVNQKIYPIEIWLDFWVEKSSIKLLELKTQEWAINVDNQYSFSINIKWNSNIVDTNTLDYYYSFNGINYKKIDTEVEINSASWDTVISQDIDKSMSIDISNEKDWDINIFAKALNWELESNVLKVKLLKDTNPLEAPSDFTTKDIMYNKVTYTWKDNSLWQYDEKKFILKDENGKIIVDNIPANTTSYTENSLNWSTTYKRMLCSVLDSFESCTNLIMYSTPIPPRIINMSFYESLNASTWIRNSNYSFSNEWIVKVNYRGEIYLEWIKAWVTDVYIKDGYGRITDIIQVTVIEKPKPKVYDINLYAWDWTYIDFPEDIRKYNYVVEWWNGIFNGSKRLRLSANSLSIDTNSVWTATIRLKEKTWYWFDKYVINLKVTAYEENYTLNVSDALQVSYSSKFNINVDDRSIAYTSWWNNKYIYWLKAWNTKFKFYYDGWLRRIFNVIVNPIPKPQEINVTTEIWKQIYYDGDMKNGYNYTVSKNWMLRFREYKTALRMYADATWTAKVYIRSPKWNYITHIFNITVNPLPVMQFTCETPVWVKCESYAYWSDEWYYYTVSNAWFVNLKVWRYFYPQTNKKYEELEIFWIKEWEVDVYVYKLWDHIATIKTKVLPPVPRINTNPYSIKVKEWQSKKVSIISWWWDYKRWTYDDKIIGFSVSNNDKEANVSWKKPWITYPTITDKYWQTTEIKVTVIDSTLIFDRYSVDIKANYDYGYINIDDYYVWIKTIKKNNDNVNAFIFEYKDEQWEDRKQLRIKWIKDWESIVELEDYEGNKKTVKVKVSGWSSAGNNWWSNWNSEQPVTPEEEEKAMQEIDKQLEELFKELWIDWVEINWAYDSNAWCTINTQDKCKDNALDLSAKALKINLLNKITPKIDDIVEKMFAKYGKRWAEIIIKRLQTNYSNVSNNHKIAIETLVIWFKLRLLDEEYREGMLDVLSLNNLYDIAIEIWAWYAIWELAKKTSEILIKKYWEKVAIKFWAKAIPIAWRWFAWYAIATAWTENITYLSNCYWNINVDWKSPSYYCWVLTANWLLILWGIWVSHTNPKGWFKFSNKIETKFDKSKVDFIKNRMDQMDQDILKKNLDNPDAFVKSFEDGKYPNLKEIDVTGESYWLIYKDWKIRTINNYSLDSKNINYVLLNENWNFRLVFWQNHSYLSQWKNVEYAWSIKFNSNWFISYVDNWSWHYKPDFSDKIWINNVIKTFNERFWTSIDSNIFKEYNY